MADLPPFRTRPATLLLAAGFAALLVLPLADLALDLDPTPSVIERRSLAPVPGRPANLDELLTFPKRFEKAFDDRFGFRDLLLRVNALLKVYVLWDGNSRRVVLGRKGWLYYGKESQTYHRAEHPFTSAELDAWRALLERRHSWLRRRGIELLVAVAPNKESIYPEFLPPSAVRVGRRARLDQLLGHLDACGSPVRILDLRPTLLAARQQDRVYHRTDTHWNRVGSFAAAQAILERVRLRFPEVDPLTRQDWERTVTYRPGQDLAQFLGLEIGFEEEYIDLVPVRELPATRTAEAPPGALESWTAPVAGPRTVVLRDSFANSMLPFLVNAFPRTTLVRGGSLARDLIDAERPGLVIHEMVERHLQEPMPADDLPDDP